jgi:hypothetical protein
MTPPGVNRSILYRVGECQGRTGRHATPPSGDVQGLVSYANTHFERAQRALRNGDFATYGEEMRLVEDALRQLAILTGASPIP